MSDYTPTTEDVLTAALDGGIYSEAEFDRWYAAEKAEAWDEGRAVGYNDGNGGESAFRQTNPYREA